MKQFNKKLFTSKNFKYGYKNKFPLIFFVRNISFFNDISLKNDIVNITKEKVLIRKNKHNSKFFNNFSSKVNYPLIFKVKNMNFTKLNDNFYPIINKQSFKLNNNFF